MQLKLTLPAGWDSTRAKDISEAKRKDLGQEVIRETMEHVMSAADTVADYDQTPQDRNPDLGDVVVLNAHDSYQNQIGRMPGVAHEFEADVHAKFDPATKELQQCEVTYPALAYYKTPDYTFSIRRDGERVSFACNDSRIHGHVTVNPDGTLSQS